MVARIRIAVKFFTYGLLIGILFAPRGGKETRSVAVAWVKRTVKERIGG